ncbi:hypothetical protein [Paenibacillus beijingensis]|uniref:hypothetical protein n=1 Tax=Paenibacillus beijingensis TaxID=1126833 RepID=UPI000A5C4E77|nr:hypothetical protein [Paenibacillus beijingensis]
MRLWMEQDHDHDGHLSKHSAFALALLDDSSSAPRLRDMARDRDPVVPETGSIHKCSYARGYASIFLLGLLADKEAASGLYRILEANPDTFPTPDEKRELPGSRLEVCFQYISFSVMALARIGDRHLDTRIDTAEAYRKLLRRGDIRLFVTLPGAPHISYEMNANIREAVENTLTRWGAQEAEG